MDFQDKRTDDMKLDEIAGYEFYREKITRGHREAGPKVSAPEEPTPCDMAAYRFRYHTITDTQACGNTEKRSLPGRSIFSRSRGTSARCADSGTAIGRFPVTGDVPLSCFPFSGRSEFPSPGLNALECALRFPSCLCN